MARVLVTGGAGYVGSHAAKHLAAQGHVPVTYDSLVHGHRAAVRWGPLHVGELADRDRLEQVLRAERIEAVMHFAALADVGESVRSPHLYYQANVAGTLSLLEAMRAAQVRALVFSSTCAVYGAPERLPLDEDHPLGPCSPYGRSKLMVEGMLADYAHAFGLKAVALRYFNAAGASADGEIGELHAPEHHLIPLALAATRPGAAPLTVFGQDYPTADGTCVRDYVHVTDLARAHGLALARLAAGTLAPAYNLGCGRGTSVRAVLEAVGRHVGRQVAHRDGPRRPGDPAELVACPARAARELGWRATHSELDVLVASAAAWWARSARAGRRATGS